VNGITDLTAEKFHEALHKDIDKPVYDFRRKWKPVLNSYTKVQTGAHLMPWAEALIFLKQSLINVQVYLNFKKTDLSDAEYEKLKRLACEGIGRYWSQKICVSGNVFTVWVQAYHRQMNAIPVDLYIETDNNKYARSMNPGLLGVDASFVYNQGFYSSRSTADDDFKLVSAHEFGHSVLKYVGGFALSWGHKGSTNMISQSVRPSTPGYPKSGPLDLMKYYDWEKAKIQFKRRIENTQAMEVDIKRLIWGAEIKWIK
jgi:hypothetical protein